MFMTKLDKLLLAGETLHFHTRKSFVIFTLPLVWTALTAFFYLQFRQLALFPGLPLLNNFAPLAWIPGLLALFSWLNQGLLYLTADFIVTNQRVILREGFFFRHSTETRLSAIAEIKVDQSLVGQLLDFGNITVNSFGGGAEVFSAIRAPYAFQRKVSELSLKKGA